MDLRLTTNYCSEKMFNWRNNPEIYRWCRQSGPLTQEQHDRWFKWMQTDSNTRMFMITEPYVDYRDKNKEFCVGVCGLTNIDWIARHAEFSLYIDPLEQHKGYATEALKRLIEIGFNIYNLNKIWGETFEDNPARQLFEKLGMTSRPMHKAHYFKNGEFVDTYCCEIFKPHLTY